MKKTKTIIKEFMEERGLELSEEKTLITNISDGFDFLGWNFRKYKEKLIIKPNKKSIKGIKEKIATIIKENKAAKQENLIKQLNPIIIGWSNYHQSVCSKKIFQKLDGYIFKELYNWALKRHRQKGKKWVNSKYWKKISKRNWVFKSNETELKRFTDTPIVRHYWLNTNKNTYLDEEYFLNLKEKKKSNKFQKIRQTVAFNLQYITN